MDPITIQVLLCPAQDLPGGFISHAIYDTGGQGSSIQEAQESAKSVIVNFLGTYVRAGKPLPQPERQLTTLEQVTNYFWKEVPSGARVVKYETVKREAEGGLPQLIFDFYRLQD